MVVAVGLDVEAEGCVEERSRASVEHTEGGDGARKSIVGFMFAIWAVEFKVSGLRLKIPQWFPKGMWTNLNDESHLTASN